MSLFNGVARSAPGKQTRSEMLPIRPTAPRPVPLVTTSDATTVQASSEAMTAAHRPDLTPPPNTASVQMLAAERDRNNGTDRRGDRRSRREEERDRETRIPEGGRDEREGSHFQSDWAGRAILARYLTGGGDWHIVDNPQWNSYMMGNATLRARLQNEVTKLAHRVRGASGGMSIARTIHADMENGEGIVGYQYLHGSNADVGDFQITGTGMGSAHEVTMELAFTWNDVIDPNPQYTTDNWKSTVAEVITLGQPTPYTIHITWHSSVAIRFDEAGNVTDVSGYPLMQGE